MAKKSLVLLLSFLLVAYYIPIPTAYASNLDQIIQDLRAMAEELRSFGSEFRELADEFDGLVGDLVGLTRNGNVSEQSYLVAQRLVSLLDQIAREVKKLGGTFRQFADRIAVMRIQLAVLAATIAARNGALVIAASVLKTGLIIIMKVGLAIAIGLALGTLLNCGIYNGWKLVVRKQINDTIAAMNGILKAYGVSGPDGLPDQAKVVYQQLAEHLGDLRARLGQLNDILRRFCFGLGAGNNARRQPLQLLQPRTFQPRSYPQSL